MELTRRDVKYQVLATAVPASVNVSGTQRIGTTLETVAFTDSASVAYSLALLIQPGDVLTMDFSDGTVTGTVVGTNQVETATIVAAAGATTAGNLTVTVTSAIVTGSPLDIPVGLTLADNDADKVATAVRAALNATAAVTDHYTVGGVGADYSLTAIEKAANDATLNLAHANDTSAGITDAPNSTNTTAGVGTTIAYKMAGTAWDATDYEGTALPVMTKLHALLMVCESVGGNVEINDGLNTINRAGPFTVLEAAPDGGHLFAGAPVTFAGSLGPVQIVMDVQAGI